ncbi:MAG: hypothetical protein ABWY18_09280 [Tardiphaga sp.]
MKLRAGIYRVSHSTAAVTMAAAVVSTIGGAVGLLTAQSVTLIALSATAVGLFGLSAMIAEYRAVHRD